MSEYTISFSDSYDTTLADISASLADKWSSLTVVCVYIGLCFSWIVTLILFNMTLEWATM